MENTIISTDSIPVDLLIEAKGRGVLATVSPDKLIEDCNTQVSDKVLSVIVRPRGDSFLVLAKSPNEYKEKQPIVIMSKVVLKNLKAVLNAPEEEPVLRNSFRGKEEFQKKWNTRSSK